MVGVSLLAEARATGMSVRIDGERLIVRGPRAAGLLAKQLLDNKPSVVGALMRERPAWPTDASNWSEDARHRFLERLGIADDLGLPTDPGTPAHDIALREARRAAAGIPSDISRSRSPDLIDDALAAFAAFADLGGLVCTRVQRAMDRKGLSP